MDKTAEFFKYLQSIQSSIVYSNEHQQGIRHRFAKRRASLSRSPSESTPAKVFMKESYDILNRISHLAYSLVSLRRAYLNLNSSSSFIRAAVKDQLSGSTSALDTLQEEHAVFSMTEREKDEFDIKTRSDIQSILKHIQELKALSDGLAKLSMKSDATFIPSLFGKPNLEIIHAKLLNQHRQSIMTFLQHQLMRVSDMQKQLKEKRLEQNMRMQESFILTAGAFQAKQASNTSSTQKGFLSSIITPHIPTTHPEGWADDLDDLLANAKENTVNQPNLPNLASNGFEEEQEDEAFLNSLSEQERLALQTENDSILNELETAIDQVQKVAQSLNEVGDLHTQLSRHLGIQQETLESIYEDTYTSLGYIEDANVYLRKAEKNFGETRWWIFIFLLVASFILLFLDWYYM